MAKITISYRRADSDAIAGRIRDRLALQYGDDAIFMDIDNIPLGVDFRMQIREALSQVDILLVVIGPRWRGPRREGKFRIFDEADPCRVEVEQGLERGIATIPLLVGGATMPTADELPETLRPLSFHNAAAVDTGRDFHQHMDRLIRSIDQILNPRRTAAPKKTARTWLPWTIAGGAASALVLALVVALAIGLLRLPSSPASAPQVAQPAPPAPQIAAPSAPAAAPQPAPARPPPKRYASAAEAAEACEPGSASIFYEDFKKPEPDWLGLGQLTNGNAYFDGGQLVIKATADADRMVGRAAALFRNASLCVRVVAPPAQANPGDGGGGIVFWATSPANGYADRAYAVMIDPTGRYSIARSADNSIYDLVKEEPFAAIKSGLGAVNLIKVAARTTGNSVWINGNRAYDFAGQREADNQFIGFIASSEQNQVDEWRFLDMVVVSPNFANELTDYRVAPQTALQVDNVGSATPTSIPGARTIRTGDLYEAYLKTTLDGAHFVLIDALTDTHAQTIAGAQRMDYAGEGNSFTDDVQVRLEKDLKAAAKNDLATPLVFFCEGAQSWESYNAALRAEKIGFTNVYWYRGGIFAWQHAGLPMK